MNYKEVELKKTCVHCNQPLDESSLDIHCRWFGYCHKTCLHLEKIRCDNPSHYQHEMNRLRKKLLKLRARKEKLKRRKEKKSSPNKKLFEYYISDEFLRSFEWKEARYKVLRKYAGHCMLCKANNKVLHVDHIKPRRIFPQLSLDINNLQVLCDDCNHGKSYKFTDDWRPKELLPNDRDPINKNTCILRKQPSI